MAALFPRTEYHKNMTAITALEDWGKTTSGGNYTWADVGESVPPWKLATCTTATRIGPYRSAGLFHSSVQNIELGWAWPSDTLNETSANDTSVDSEPLAGAPTHERFLEPLLDSLWARNLPLVDCTGFRAPRFLS